MDRMSNIDSASAMQTMAAMSFKSAADQLTVSLRQLDRILNLMVTTIAKSMDSFKTSLQVSIKILKDFANAGRTSGPIMKENAERFATVMSSLNAQLDGMKGTLGDFGNTMQGMIPKGLGEKLEKEFDVPARASFIEALKPKGPEEIMDIDIGSAMGQLFDTIETAVPPADQLLQNLTQQGEGIDLAGTFGKITGGAPGKKQMGGFSKAIKGAAGGLAAMGPQMLIFSLLMEPIQALLGAFLEPLNMLLPIFEMWGTILSQLLMPIVMALMAILMPLTPLLIAIVNSLMPILDIILPLIMILVPVLELLIAGLLVVINIFTIVTEAIGGFFQMLADFLARLSDAFFGWIQGAVDWFNNLLTGIVDTIIGFWQDLMDKIKGFFEGGFDGDPDTWY